MVMSFQTIPFKGGPTHFHTVKAPLRDDAGNIIGICGLARDITDLRRAKEALKQLYLGLEHRVIHRTVDLSAMESRLHQMIATTPATLRHIKSRLSAIKFIN
jgi:hypothetical protein